ncbi:MAG TPA: hypothetical protein PK725_03715 [Rhodocyclaceae bacterium]|jgi:uncharacterized membrane protein|nr:hypothetical protein [Rhodocyclaceae bacterium]HRQ46029.1 hypothetical protein [Rhodocyclaceae bacterium]
MAPYHHLLAHFPIALLSLAFFIILMRGFSSSELARRFDAVLPHLLLLGLAVGLVTLATGLIIWPSEATTTSPMGRNKILISVWMIACWGVVLALRWRGGQDLWNGPGRALMLGFGTMGMILLATTGTLGGHLLGSPSRLTGLFREIGWEVYHTYYAPDWVLLVLVAVGAAGVAVGLFGARSRPAA